MKNDRYKKFLLLMKKIIIFQHKAANEPSCTVQYSCKHCSYKFPLDGDCDKDGYWDCPNCGKISHSKEINGDMVASTNLYKNRKTLEELIVKLEKTELEE